MQISAENNHAIFTRGGRVFSRRIALSSSVSNIRKPSTPPEEEELSSPLVLGVTKSLGYTNKPKKSTGQSFFSGQLPDTSFQDRTPSLNTSFRGFALGNESKFRERLKSIDNLVSSEDSMKRRSFVTLPNTGNTKNSQRASKLNASLDTFSMDIPPLHNITDDRIESPVIRTFKPSHNEFLNGEVLEQLFWIPNKSEQSDSERPPATIDSTLVAFKNKAYLYGGAIDGGLSNQLWTFNPFKGKWKKRDSGGLSGRKGHASVMVKNSLYVFGGEIPSPNSLQQDVTILSNDLFCYNPNLNQWNMIKPASTSKDIITPRKHHTLCKYKNFLFVYGGISHNGAFKHDLWIFDIDQKIWKQLKVKRGELETKGIAYHSMVSAFDEKYSNSEMLVDNQGFYVFGGINEKGESLNILKRLSYEKISYDLKWSYPKTKGMAPSPRFQHSMVFFAPARCLLVYGGKYELISNNHCHNDVKILCLDDFTWVSPKILGDTIAKDVFGHSASELNGQMIVFGGFSKGKSVQNKADILELRPNEVKRLIQKSQSDEVSAKYMESQKLKEKNKIEQFLKDNVPIKIDKLSLDFEEVIDNTEGDSPQNLRKKLLSRFLNKDSNLLKRRIDKNPSSDPPTPVNNITAEDNHHPNKSLQSPLELPKIKVFSPVEKLLPSEDITSGKLEGNNNSFVNLPSIKDGNHNSSPPFQTGLKDEHSPNFEEASKLPFRSIASGSQMLLSRGMASPLIEKQKFKQYNQRADSFKNALKS